MFRYLLSFSAFLIFFGRAYQFFFFGAPYRAIFWDESLLSPVVEGLFNYTWQEYATNLKVNTFIEKDNSWDWYFFVIFYGNLYG
jgi:hypothetical protein